MNVFMTTSLFTTPSPFQRPSEATDEGTFPPRSYRSSATPLGEILHLNIQLDLARIRAEEWRHLWTEATQHLSNVFQQEKTILATVAKLEAQLVEVEAVREEAERRAEASDAPPLH